MGLIPAPRGLRLGDENEDGGKGLYYPGPGDSGSDCLRETVVAITFFCVAYC